MPDSKQDDIQDDIMLDLDDNSVCSDAVPTKTDSRSSETQKSMYGPNGVGFKLATRDMMEEIKALLKNLNDNDSQSPENSLSDADLIQALGINGAGLPGQALNVSLNLRSSSSRTA